MCQATAAIHLIRNVFSLDEQGSKASSVALSDVFGGDDTKHKRLARHNKCSFALPVLPICKCFLKQLKTIRLDVIISFGEQSRSDHNKMCATQLAFDREY